MEESAKKLVELLRSNGYIAYFVGGCVRDKVMGVTPHDYDICTIAQPERIIEIIKKAGYKYYDAGIKFGTVNVLVNDETFEVTTFRSDGAYRDARRPDNVRFIGNIQEDLSRRDFTINAMAYNPINNSVVDPFGGQRDINFKVLRAVGDPDERFKEDALRILRAMRFAIKYNFEIEKNTLNAMLKHRDLLNQVSKERITQELEKMLTCGKTIKRVFMSCRQIVGVIFPEIVKCFDFDQQSRFHTHNVYEHMLYVTDYCKTTKFEIKLAALLHDIGKPDAFFIGNDGYGHFHGHPDISGDICDVMLKNRLRLSAEQYSLTTQLIRQHDYNLMDTDKSVLKFMRSFGVDFLTDFMILKQADIDDHINLYCAPSKPCMDMSLIQKRLNKILEEQKVFQLKDLALNGKDICDITHTVPGKHVGIILNALLESVINEEVKNNRDELTDKAMKIWDNIGQKG